MAPDRQQQAEIDRAAAAWVVRLGSPALDDAGRRAFRGWLDADPAHARAFEAARRLWDGLDAPAAALAAAERRRARRIAAGGGGGAAWCCSPGRCCASGADHATDPGTQRDGDAGDGSRMTLDGNSAADVAIDADRAAGDAASRSGVLRGGAGAGAAVRRHGRRGRDGGARHRPSRSSDRAARLRSSSSTGGWRCARPERRSSWPPGSGCGPPPTGSARRSRPRSGRRSPGGAG